MALHYRDSSIRIHKIKCGPYDNNAYLLVCPKTQESVLIDTPAEPRKLIRTAGATKVKAILITHNHFDHLEGFDEVTSAIDAPVGIGEPDAQALPKAADFYLSDGDEVKAGTLTLKVLSTPGHTPGSTCVLVGNHLITGDTLFPGGPRQDQDARASERDHLDHHRQDIHAGRQCYFLSRSWCRRRRKDLQGRVQCLRVQGAHRRPLRRRPLA